MLIIACRTIVTTEEICDIQCHVRGYERSGEEGNPILDLVRGNDEHGEPNSEPTVARDGKPYTTLGYWNGPGAVEGARGLPPTGLKAVQQAVVPTAYGQWALETHGGEDVALYAQGPGSARVFGVMEQNLIYDVMVRALGWD